MKPISLTLDGKTVEAREGATVLEVARSQGIEIPALCYDPRLPPYASCFICIVEVEGRRGMVPACATKAEAGMVVRTATEDIRKVRKLGLELLLSNHHGDCIAPCNMACPAGIDIRAYLSEAMRGNFTDALRIIKERNPFPSVCGRICPHPCEDNCRRTLVDEPVSINQVKRFISDRDRCSVDAWKPALAPKNGKKVAILGGGPAGMSAAYYLAVLGYSPVVFESMPKAGGMLRYGVPDYRLPPEVLDAEIDQIVELGVELRTGKTWGKDFRLDGLRKEGFAAIVTAIGAWTGQSMGCEGEENQRVWSGIAMLEKVNKGEEVNLGDRVVVVGGGNTAIDCARTALRLGAKEVTLVYRRGRKEMPANPEEIHEAEEEGVKMRFLTAPTGFAPGENCVNMSCVEMRLGAPDASGRRRPEPVPGSETVIPADSVIAAIGQKVRWDGFDADGLKLTKWGTPDADPATLRSPSHPDVYVCGDCLNGPATAIEAIAGGRMTALSIHSALSGEKTEVAPHPFNIRKGKLKDLTREEHAQHPKKPRARIPQLDAFSRARSCSEVSHTLAQKEALDEANRCLLCGCQEVEDCQLRRYAEEYGAKGELHPGVKAKAAPMPEHPYIARDHNKCILCGRCVRVCAELQGVGAIGLAGRGFVTDVESAWCSDLPDYGCKSCGQCVGTCPAGALSARFKDGKVPAWRADKRSAVCPYCGVGCVLDLSVADGKAQAVANKLSSSEGNAMICSRAFSGFDLLEQGPRLKEPLIKEGGKWRPAKWDEAMTVASEGLKKASGKQAAVLASPRLTNEALYLLQKIARVALATNNIGGPGIYGEADTPARALGANASTASLDHIASADMIVVSVPGLDSAYPSIAAAIREAALRGAKVHVCSSGPTGLEKCASRTLKGGMARRLSVYKTWLLAAVERPSAAALPGLKEFRLALASGAPASAPGSAEVHITFNELAAAERPLLIAEPQTVPAGELASLLDLFLLLGRERNVLLLRATSNAQGALDMGVDGLRLPGHRLISDPAARAAISALWKSELPDWDGLPSAGIVQLAQAGGLKGLLAWGDAGLDGLDLPGAFVVAGEWYLPSAKHPASVVFPAALFAEDGGTLTSFDRRIRASAAWRPEGSPQSNWSTLSDLGKHLGLPGYESPGALRAEIGKAFPGYASASWEGTPGKDPARNWEMRFPAALLDPSQEDAQVQKRLLSYLSREDQLERFIKSRLAAVASGLHRPGAAH